MRRRKVNHDITRDNHDKTRDYHDKTRDNDNVIIVENFDKPTLSDLLERKAKKVGEVVLVNGKPAIIKKRKLDKIMQGSETKNLQKIRIRRIEQKKKVGQSQLQKRMKIPFHKSLKRKVLRKKVVI